MTRNDAELVYSTHDVLGESPWWCPATNRLWWLDVRSTLLRSLDLSGVKTDVSAHPLHAETTAVIGADGYMLLVGSQGISQFSVDVPRSVTRPWFNSAVTRTNDATTDARGRIWIGWFERSRRHGHGRIGVIDGADVQLVLDDLTMPNGLGWLTDRHTLVFVDTASGQLSTIRIDLDTNQPVGPSRPIVRIPTALGLADGLAVDVDNCIWLAIWGAGRVHRYSLAGKLIEEVRVPTRHVTSCAFGGRDLNELYITTASLDPEARTLLDGGLFVHRAATSGVGVREARATAPLTVARRSSGPTEA